MRCIGRKSSRQPIQTRNPNPSLDDRQLERRHRWLEDSPGREPVCGATQGLREDPLDVQIKSNIEQNRDGEQSQGNDRHEVDLAAHSFQILK